MMKRVIVVIMILLLVIPNAGCLVYQGKDWSLYYLVAENVPGISNIRAGNANTEVLKRDAQGRVLFSYQGDAYGPYINDTLCICAIAQKVEWEDAYFYEDIFYLTEDSFENFTEQDIEDLKKKNDWNAPLEIKKFKKNVRRDLNARESLFEANLDEATAALNETIGDKKMYTDVLFFDSDGVGKCLYVMFQCEKDEKGNEYNFQVYFIMLGLVGSFKPETGIVAVEDIYHYQNQLHEFKKANGWEFQGEQS